MCVFVVYPGHWECTRVVPAARICLPARVGPTQVARAVLPRAVASTHHAFMFCHGRVGHFPRGNGKVLSMCRRRGALSAPSGCGEYSPGVGMGALGIATRRRQSTRRAPSAMARATCDQPPCSRARLLYCHASHAPMCAHASPCAILPFCTCFSMYTRAHARSAFNA